MDSVKPGFKRRYNEDVQLLTPHPSSSTQYLPSSPTNSHQRLLPSLQYARPNVHGEWYYIGRSSAKNDLALPSNNRLASRVHVKLRYIEDQHAFEVKCIGHNGCSLQISGQTLFIRRATGIMVQVNSNQCYLGLNVVGSFVEIQIPREDETGPETHGIPLPSSPVPHMSVDEEEVPAIDSYREDQQLSSSPAPYISGMVTPSTTPQAKRIKLDVHQDSSPCLQSPTSSLSDETGKIQKSALQPRLIDFCQSFTSDSAAFATPVKKTSDDRGKENVPPETSQLNVVHPTTQVEEQPSATAKDTTANRLQEIEVDAATSDKPIDLPGETLSPQEGDESLPQDEDDAPQEVNFAPSSPSSEVQDEIGNDPEFVDMILTTLATSAISPAPIASFVPFFGPNTTLEQIEDFLRAQTAISEVKRTGKDASGNTLRSTWYYEPSNDTDELRRSRLQQLQKPVRRTKKVHVQYFWRPVHLRSAPSSNGLLENRPKRKARTKKQAK